MTSHGKEFSSLLFTSRTVEKQPEGHRSLSPHSTRSPSISGYGRSTGREGSASRRRSLTPPGGRETPPPVPPPALSLLDSSRGTWSTTGPQELQGDGTYPLQQEGTSYGEDADETWVTVFGFHPEEQSTVLREFSKCGDILRFGSGREDKVNWVHIKFANKYQAQRALLKNGQVISGRLMVGVQRLDDRHRAAAEGLSWPPGNGVPTATVKPIAIRPYKLDGPAAQGLVPTPAVSLWSKINEFVFGLSAPNKWMAVVTYTKGTKLIKAAAQLLQLPPRATATALVLLHRFLQSAARAQDADITLIAACLLLASKVEEAPVKLVDLFNALKRCQSVQSGDIPDASDVIVGDQYNAVKQLVHVSEQVLLRETHFNLAVAHAAPFVLNFGKSLGCSRSAVRLAIFLLNDSLVYTDACLHFTAAEIAAGCLTVALGIVGKDIGQEGQESVQLGILGLAQERISHLGQSLVDMLEHVL